MRLVYIYVSNGSTTPGTIEWSPEQTTHDPFAFHFGQEGFCHLFKRLIAKKIIQDVLVVIESSRFPGTKYISNNISAIAVPHLDEIKQYLKEDDIVWARCGFRSWFPFLQEWHDLDRWLLFYRAASNRGAWRFWDIVLNDLQTGYSQDIAGRFYYPFNKPINSELFFPMDEPRIYDLCVGASHIHRKKGQHLIIPILEAYEKKYGLKLKCVVPGAFRQESSYLAFAECSRDICLPSMLPKDELRKVYNQSKLFVHCGGAGQNDRGPLEAMCCGTPVMLSNEQYHPGWMHSTSTPYSFHITPEDPDIAAGQINHALTLIDSSKGWREAVKNVFETANGVENVIIPQFEQLFSLIALWPHKERQGMFNQLLEKHL